METHVAAVDLGGTKIAAAVVSSSGRIVHKLKQPIRKHDAFEQIAQVLEEAAHGAGVEVAAAGVCVPGIYFEKSGEAWAPNLWGWDNVPLRAELAARLSVPAVIDSDRAAYVLGEQWCGAARGLTDVVFLAIGTGIGAGILIDGRLCRGSHDIAGAVGWFALDPRYKDEYRKLGCFEAEAAGPAVARRAQAATAEQVVAAARTGDAEAREILDAAAAYISMAVANLVSTLNPQMVVLGGGLMQGAGDLLLDGVRRGMLDWAQPVAAQRVRIELTQLGEDAGVLGAAKLALDYVRR